MIFIMVNDYFSRTEPVIISRPSNNTTAEPIDSCEWPAFPEITDPQPACYIQPVCYLLMDGGSS